MALAKMARGNPRLELGGMRGARNLGGRRGAWNSAECAERLNKERTNPPIPLWDSKVCERIN